MPNLNKVMLMGNLTRDPELRFTPANTAVANIGLAINRRWKNQQGEQQEETTFIDCEAWGRTAEVINQYLKKGRPIYIEGRLKLDQWQDKNTQENRSKLKVVIESFEFLDSKGSAGGGGGGGGASGSADAHDSHDQRQSPPPRSNPSRPPAQRPASAPSGGASGGGGGGEPHQSVEEEDIPF